MPAMTNTERSRLHRERHKLSELDEGEPWEGLLGEEREQAIRDHWGSAKSETRTQAERQAVADRIVRKQSTRPHALEETALVG